MTGFKGMDELLWRNDLEDVFNWAKRLQITTKMQEFDEDKFFKIVRFNM
jgi:hypothetical protein